MFCNKMFFRKMLKMSFGKIKVGRAAKRSISTSDFRLLSMINVVKNNNTCTRFTEIEADKLISN